MVKEFATYKRKIDNIFSNQKNNIQQLEKEISYLIIKANELRQAEWKKTLDSGNRYYGELADYRYNLTRNYLLNRINASNIGISDSVKLLVMMLQ